MSFVAFLTGYPASGKYILAKRLVEQVAEPVTILDHHRLERMILSRSNATSRHRNDNYQDCAELAAEITNNLTQRNQLTLALRTVAMRAYDMPPANTSSGKPLADCHKKAIDDIQSAIIATAKENPEHNYIFTQPLYEGNPYHKHLVEQVKSLAGNGRDFYGFRINVDKDMLLEQARYPDRQKSGRLVNATALEKIMQEHTLTTDPAFVDQPVEKRAYAMAAHQLADKIAPSLARPTDPAVLEALAKKNKAFCTKIHFTKEGLDGLAHKYEQVRGMSRFLADYLSATPSLNSVRMLLNQPQLAEWTKDGTALIMPNYPHIDRDKLLADPKHYKDTNPEGLSLVAWFIHPEHLKASPFKDPARRENHLPINHELYPYLPGLDKHKNSYNADRAGMTEEPSIGDIARNSTTPYLHSVLALTKKDIPWLKELKKTGMEHIQKVYGATQADHVEMYFNTIINKENVPLHLHIKVNNKRHPMLRAKSLSLDEIVEGLENGKTTRDMILERPYYTNSGIIPQLVGDLPGVTMEENVPSPYASANPEAIRTTETSQTR